MGQLGLTASDLAGLNPEDVASLLGSAQAFGSDRQAAVNLLYDERVRQQERQDAIAAAAMVRKQKNEQRLADSMKDIRESVAEVEAAEALAESKKALATHKAALDAEADKLTDTEKEAAGFEIDKLEAEIAKIESQTDKYEAETEQVGKTEVDPITPMEQIAQDELEKAEYDAIVFGSYKDDQGNDVEISFETRKAYALQANNRRNNYIYYFITEPQEIEGWFNDIPGKIKPIFLPEDVKTGKRITSRQFMELIKKSGLSEEEFLIKYNLLEVK